MESLVHEVIREQNIEHFFQPIWRIALWEVYGYEGLLRIQNEPTINPEILFNEARREGVLYELDILSFTKAIEDFPFHNYNQHLLFLNIYLSTVLDPRFIRLLKCLIFKYPNMIGKVVIELNETNEEEHCNDPLLKKNIKVLKQFGFIIAFDDVGKSVATFQKLNDFKPTFVKLDRYFSEGLAESKGKQDTISMLSQYLDPDMTFIFEGVERDVDLAQAKIFNVPIVQGYLLGEPQKLKEDCGRNFIEVRLIRSSIMANPLKNGDASYGPNVF